MPCFENKKRYKTICIALILSLLCIHAQAQEREWEIDRIEERNKLNEKKKKAVLSSLEDSWEIKLSYGQWIFNDRVKSKENALFYLSPNFSNWQLSGTWHFQEKLFADFSLEFQMKKDVPSPDVSTILNGDDIDLEGAAGIFIPLDAGLYYYLALKDKFRVFSGLSAGVVLANSTYIVVEGDLNNGIERTNNQKRDGVLTGGIVSGFDYRLGEKSQFNLTLGYTWSQAFGEPLGGYTNYEGILAQLGFSILIFTKTKSE